MEQVEVRGDQRLLAQPDYQPHHQIPRNGQQEDEDVKQAGDQHHDLREPEVVAGFGRRVQDELRVVVGEVQLFVDRAEVVNK